MNSLTSLMEHPNLYKNSHYSFLIEKSLQKKEGILGPEGELMVQTGNHTGRSAKDKYVVVNEASEQKVWWENNVNKMTDSVFQELTIDVINFLKAENDLFFTNRSIGSSAMFSIGIDFVSTQASAALFTQYMFKPFQDGAHNEQFTILHAPNFKLDPKKYGTRSETVIVTCFKEKRTIIVGTLYAGEIKKSMFSVMNFVLPDLGILPMHSGANQNNQGESFVFLGLSGTGKTTLSTDENLLLIGDDEHGVSDVGIFNFEGGCYAKTFKLDKETEPGIYQASTQYASLLENVKIADDRSNIDFFDASLSENGRSSYPLNFITDRVGSGIGKIPKHIFYLSADAFGVLPPVSLLTHEQAMDYFKLGYTAKLAGTEVGVKSPTATFSTCFGAPFMLRRPEVYSNLLNKFTTKYDIKVWLINTGWYGGSYGQGTRFPIKVTRNIIRQIQAGKLENCEFVQDGIFNLKIPKSIDLVDPSILFPKNAWTNQEEYKKIAKTLAASFEEELIKLKKS